MVLGLERAINNAPVNKHHELTYNKQTYCFLSPALEEYELFGQLLKPLDNVISLKLAS